MHSNMTPIYFNYAWLTYFLLTQSFCIGISSTFHFYQDSNNEAGVLFDRDHTNKENILSLDSYLGKATPRLKRSTANETLGEKKTLKRNEEPDIVNQTDKTEEKATSLAHLDQCEDLSPSLLGNWDSKSDSCANRCSNQTRFFASNLTSVPLCMCDAACNDIFMDCCSDYTKHCGTNVNLESDPVYLARSYFYCETDLEVMTNTCEVPDGVWMIARCPKEWPDDVIRDKCHAPPSELNNQTYEAFAPVYSPVNQLTYRNQYCALCHNIEKYELWDLIFNQSAVPPSHFRRKTLISFIEKYAHNLKGVDPRSSQPLRYCYFPTVVKTCPKKSDLANQQCVNGTVEIVQWKDTVYKNRACSSCHQVKSPCDVPLPRSGICFVFSSLTRAVALQDYGVSLVTRACLRDQVFDPYLGSCRRSYRPLLQSSKDSYQVSLWLLKYSFQALILKSSLRNDLARNFKLNTSQVTNVQLVEKYSDVTITFTLHLTRFQSLALSSEMLSRESSEVLELQRLFRFEKVFSLELSRHSGRTNFTIYRVNVRRLSCIHLQVYIFQEYVVLDNQRIYVNSTAAIYEPYEYELNTTSSEPNVNVCLRAIPLQCNGSFINLNSSEYHLLPNLTLIYKSLKYDFGDYAYENETVYICVKFKRKHQISTSEEQRNRLTLQVFTYVGFLLSVVCLFALILTYLIFEQLRSLPGKNLMSLALSLALAEILWMFGSAFSENRSLCTGIAIANHYFFMVFFTASSVIAFHSCSVFGRSISLRKSPEEEKRKFIFYFLVIWGTPGLFVLIFSLLDHYDIFVIEYGGSDICWLGTSESKLFLFILPFGTLILFNLTLFVFIASRLCKNRKSNSQVLANEALKKRNRENVLICIKLSTLMGFSWLFILLHVVLESETDVFLYLFVIFVSFQGVFICVAFLFNRRCFELYRGLMSKRTSNSGNSLQNNANKGNRYTQETKL